MAAVLCPHRFCRATRQWVIRTPKDKGRYQYAVLLTTVSDLASATGGCLRRRAMIEATFCQDKQALGLVKRRQHKWEAQQMLLLLARLAHHILLWSKRWLSQVLATRWRLEGYGLRGCSRKCTPCLGAPGGDGDGWSACALTLCIPWPSYSSKALRRFLGIVSRYVVGAKPWQLRRTRERTTTRHQSGTSVPRWCR